MEEKITTTRKQELVNVLIGLLSGILIGIGIAQIISPKKDETIESHLESVKIAEDAREHLINGLHIGVAITAIDMLSDEEAEKAKEAFEELVNNNPTLEEEEELANSLLDKLDELYLEKFGEQPPAR